MLFNNIIKYSLKIIYILRYKSYIAFLYKYIQYYINIFIIYFFINYKPGYFCSMNKIIVNKYNKIVPTKLVIVAHPDDEVLFFGNLLEKYGSDIKVICITNSQDPIRSHEFISIMNLFKILQYEMWDFIDGKEYNESIDLKNKLYKSIKGFNEIYTHSITGETGHPQHIMLHRYIAEIASEKLYICCDNKYNEISKIKRKALNIYESQKSVINNYLYMSMYENHIKYSIN